VATTSVKIGTKLACPMSTPSGYSSVATDPEQAVDFDSMQLDNSVAPVCSESSKVETRDSGGPAMRKWRQFPGRNQFFCNGRLMLGRGLGLFYLTCGLIVVTTLLFLAFEYVSHSQIILALYGEMSMCPTVSVANQHTIPQHMNSTRSAILLYIELALVLEEEKKCEVRVRFVR